MKYFLIAGEASGDLHAAHLMESLLKEDSDAEFCFVGGDRMSAVGGTRLRHYRTIAYMGFIPVLLHLHAILRVLKVCRRVIVRWRPEVVILVDYPGFNLKIARYVRSRTNIPVFYYISPKIWAWKEHRIRNIRRDVSELFSILPFEVPFFEEKHHYKIHYVGNPSVDEISAFRSRYKETFEEFTLRYQLSAKPIIALLPGSRKQEIKDNLAIMVQAARTMLERGYQMVVAGVSDIEKEFYSRHLGAALSDAVRSEFHILEDKTNKILQHSEVALVTSGTATLETALFDVPQVVCYYAPLGRLVRFLKRHLLKVKYISLVNLILNRPAVTELIADEMNPSNLSRELASVVKGGSRRQAMLEAYKEMSRRLGPAGAPKRAAAEMVALLKTKYHRNNKA